MKSMVKLKGEINLKVSLGKYGLSILPRSCCKGLDFARESR